MLERWFLDVIRKMSSSVIVLLLLLEFKMDPRLELNVNPDLAKDTVPNVVMFFVLLNPCVSFGMTLLELIQYCLAA